MILVIGKGLTKFVKTHLLIRYDIYMYTYLIIYIYKYVYMHTYTYMYTYI